MSPSFSFNNEVYRACGNVVHARKVNDTNPICVSGSYVEYFRFRKLSTAMRRTAINFLGTQVRTVTISARYFFGIFSSPMSITASHSFGVKSCSVPIACCCSSLPFSILVVFLKRALSQVFRVTTGWVIADQVPHSEPYWVVSRSEEIGNTMSAECLCSVGTKGSISGSFINSALGGKPRPAFVFFSNVNARPKQFDLLSLKRWYSSSIHRAETNPFSLMVGLRGVNSTPQAA